MSLAALALTGVVVFVTHALEAVTGFGCTVLALPFVAALLGIKTAVPLLAAIAWILALYIAVTKRRMINFRVFRIIVFFAGLGLPVGMFAFRAMDAGILKRGLAVFIILSASWQLRLRFGNRGKKTPTEAPAGKRIPAIYYLLLLAGGLVHGAFASGGPLIVLYAARALPDKGQFRATLCLLWTSLNSVLLIGYALSGTFTPAVSGGIAAMLPFLLAGILAGEKIHDRVHPDLFGKLVFSALLVTGIIMLL